MNILEEVVAADRDVRLVEPGIYTVLPAASPESPYDRKAAGYDMVVGSSLYNRVMWGTAPNDYSAFAREALDAHPGGRFLDAGCGSMLFTARAYLESDRPIVAVDLSLGMLRRARRRLLRLAGRMPDRIVLLQADLRDMPLRPASCQTVMSMGILHLLEDVSNFVASLSRLLITGGRLYLTSLVANDRFGDRYLRLLHREGEVARPRTSAQLQSALNGAAYRVKGNMAYAVKEVNSLSGDQIDEK